MEDVIIIGGGTAGLFAALHLDKNLKVTIIERETFPASKLCAGMLVDPAYDELKPFDPPKELYHKEKDLTSTLIDCDNNRIIPIKMVFKNIKRKSLYTWLVSLLGKNVTIMDKCYPTEMLKKDSPFKLKIKTPGGEKEMESTYLIGAEGYNSFCRRRFYDFYNPPHIYALQYKVYQPFPGDKSLFLYDSQIAGGYYSWILPKDYGFIIGTKLENKNEKILLSKIEERYNVSITKVEKKIHPITKLDSTNQIRWGEDKFFLVGEAAGLIRSASGEGLSLALISGRKAAETINKKEEARSYCNSMSYLTAELERDIKIGRVLEDPNQRNAYFKNTL